jgi:hypothetical protein
MSEILCYRFRLTNLPGIMKLSNGASSGMTAFGRTKAPMASSGMSGEDGEDSRDPNTTFAKWVGTAILGGFPITS